jgi:hypothetical protein
VAQLLSQNLKEEKATLNKMEAFRKRVKPQQLMSEDEGRKAAASARSSRRKRAA